MKIMFASHSSELAGAELCLAVLIEEAAARGHTGSVTVPREGPLLALLQPYERQFPVTVMPLRPWMGRRFAGVVALVRLLQSLAPAFRYYKFIKANQFDVVVVNSSVIPAPLLAARMNRTKSLLIVRESVMSNPTLRSAVPRRLIRKILSSWATLTVANSLYIAEQFHYKSHLVYPELVPEHFKVFPENRAKLTTSTLRAVMLGTISSEKGQADAIEAVAKSRSEGTQIALDIYGKGSTRDLRKLHKLIRKFGLQDSVILHAPTKTPRDVFREADISLVCSRNEAFGMVTAESVLSGTPVVAYDRGGTSEILAHGGGVLVNADPDSLAATLTLLYRDRDAIVTLRRGCERSQLRNLLMSSRNSMFGILESLGGSENSARANEFERLQ